MSHFDWPITTPIDAIMPFLVWFIVEHCISALMFWSSQNKCCILQSNNTFEMERTPNKFVHHVWIHWEVGFRKFLQSLKEYWFLDGLECYQHTPLVCSSMLYVLPLLLFHNYNNNKPIFHVEWKLSMNALPNNSMYDICPIKRWGLFDHFCRDII